MAKLSEHMANSVVEQKQALVFEIQVEINALFWSYVEIHQVHICSVFWSLEVNNFSPS